jgi:hypothetical protein
MDSHRNPHPSRPEARFRIPCVTATRDTPSARATSALLIPAATSAAQRTQRTGPVSFVAGGAVPAVPSPRSELCAFRGYRVFSIHVPPVVHPGEPLKPSHFTVRGLLRCWSGGRESGLVAGSLGVVGGRLLLNGVGLVDAFSAVWRPIWASLVSGRAETVVSRGAAVNRLGSSEVARLTVREAIGTGVSSIWAVGHVKSRLLNGGVSGSSPEWGHGGTRTGPRCSGTKCYGSVWLRGVAVFASPRCFSVCLRMLLARGSHP